MEILFRYELQVDSAHIVFILRCPCITSIATSIQFANNPDGSQLICMWLWVCGRNTHSHKMLTEFLIYLSRKRNENYDKIMFVIMSHDPNDFHSYCRRLLNYESVIEMNTINRMNWSLSSTRYIKTWCRLNSLVAGNKCVLGLVNGHLKFVLFALHVE